MSKRGGRDDIQDTKSSSKLQNLDKKIEELRQWRRGKSSKKNKEIKQLISEVQTEMKEVSRELGTTYKNHKLFKSLAKSKSKDFNRVQFAQANKTLKDLMNKIDKTIQAGEIGDVVEEQKGIVASFERKKEEEGKQGKEGKKSDVKTPSEDDLDDVGVTLEEFNQMNEQEKRSVVTEIKELKTKTPSTPRARSPARQPVRQPAKLPSSSTKRSVGKRTKKDALDFKYTQFKPSFIERMSALVPRGIPGHTFTGYGTPIGEHLNEKITPKSGVDSVSMLHDLYYTMASHEKDDKKRKQLEESADQVFIDQIQKVQKGLSITNPESRYANIALLAMKSKKKSGINLVRFIGEQMKPAEEKQYTDIIRYLKNSKPEDFNKKEFRDNIYNDAFEYLDNPEIEKQREQQQFVTELKQELEEIPKEAKTKPRPRGFFFGDDPDDPDPDPPRGGGGGGSPPSSDDDGDFRDGDDLQEREENLERERQFELRRKRERQRNIQDGFKKRRGARKADKYPNWLRPMYKNVFNQIRKLDLLHSEEWEALEEKTANHLFRVHRGCAESSFDSENYKEKVNNLCETDEKIKYNLPLNKPVFTSLEGKLFGEKIDLRDAPLDYRPSGFLYNIDRKYEGITKEEARKRGVSKVFHRKGYTGRKPFRERTGQTIEPEPIYKNRTMSELMDENIPTRDPIDRTPYEFVKLKECDSYNQVILDEKSGSVEQRDKSRFKPAKQRTIEDVFYNKRFRNKKNIFRYI